MPLFTKEQLLNKDIEELRSVATALGTKHKDSNDKEDLVYDILDVQAEIKSAEMNRMESTGRKPRVATSRSKTSARKLPSRPLTRPLRTQSRAEKGSAPRACRRKKMQRRKTPS